MKKHYYTKLAGKVLLVTLVGILTMYSIHIAINHAFDEITSSFERFARPNARLLAVNNLFRDISQPWLPLFPLYPLYPLYLYRSY